MKCDTSLCLDLGFEILTIADITNSFQPAPAQALRSAWEQNREVRCLCREDVSLRVIICRKNQRNEFFLRRMRVTDPHTETCPLSRGEIHYSENVFTEAIPDDKRKKSSKVMGFDLYSLDWVRRIDVHGTSRSSDPIDDLLAQKIWLDQQPDSLARKLRLIWSRSYFNEIKAHLDDGHKFLKATRDCCMANLITRFSKEIIATNVILPDGREERLPKALIKDGLELMIAEIKSVERRDSGQVFLEYSDGGGKHSLKLTDSCFLRGDRTAFDAPMEGPFFITGVLGKSVTGETEIVNVIVLPIASAKTGMACPVDSDLERMWLERSAIKYPDCAFIKITSNQEMIDLSSRFPGDVGEVLREGFALSSRPDFLVIGSEGKITIMEIAGMMKNPIYAAHLSKKARFWFHLLRSRGTPCQYVVVVPKSGAFHVRNDLSVVMRDE